MTAPSRHRSPGRSVPEEIAAALRPATARRAIEIDTPAVLIDLPTARANLERAQAHLGGLGLAVRPHVKTHKLPALARWQVRLGAVGVTAQKVTEAEAMVDGGIDDVLIPYNVLGPVKLGRLRALAGRARLAVSADGETTVAGYAEAFADARSELSVLVELDTGAGRCGVQGPDEALRLARRIDAASGLRFAGLMTYPPAGRGAEVSARLRACIDALRAAGLPPGTVSGGGTPDLYHAADVPELTEHRPGTYVYSDRMQVLAGHGTLGDCALTVLATVVSRPTATRAVLDAGSKALTSDLVAPGRSDLGHGLIREAPDAVIVSLSEEHATVHLAEGATRETLPVGTPVRIVPNHACPVTNLFDDVHLVDGDEALGTLAVIARGSVL